MMLIILIYVQPRWTHIGNTRKNYNDHGYESFSEYESIRSAHSIAVKFSPN